MAFVWVQVPLAKAGSVLEAAGDCKVSIASQPEPARKPMIVGAPPPQPVKAPIGAPTPQPAQAPITIQPVKEPIKIVRTAEVKQTNPITIFKAPQVVPPPPKAKPLLAKEAALFLRPKASTKAMPKKFEGVYELEESEDANVNEHSNDKDPYTVRPKSPTKSTKRKHDEGTKPLPPWRQKVAKPEPFLGRVAHELEEWLLEQGLLKREEVTRKGGETLTAIKYVHGDIHLQDGDGEKLTRGGKHVRLARALGHMTYDAGAFYIYDELPTDDLKAYVRWSVKTQWMHYKKYDAHHLVSHVITNA